MKSHQSISILVFCLLLASSVNGTAQYKEYKIGPKGDTINAVTKDGLKVGKWAVHVAELP